MKACELFPGAVVRWEGKPFIIQAVNVPFCGLNEGIVGLSGTDKITCFIEGLTPLPISPAVLRGLGFEWNEYGLFKLGNLSVRYSKADAEWYATMHQRGFASPKYAHHLQGACIHLYGIELILNQNEYEKALKEEQQ